MTSVAYSPDGKSLASSSWDETIKIWDVVSRKKLASLQGHSHWVTSVAYSPDGKSLASSSYDKTIKIWDVVSGKELASLQGHSHWVTSVAYSPDGKSLASCSEDKTIKIWDIGSRKELASFQGNFESVTSVAYSPDGKSLAISSNNKTIKIWDISIPPYYSYTNHTEWTRLDVSWKENSSNLHYSSPSFSWKCSSASYLSILRSKASEEEKKQRLVSHYIRSEAWDAAFLLFSQLAFTPEKEIIRKILQKSLLQKAAEYQKQRAYDRIEKRLSQAKVLGDFPPLSLEDTLSLYAWYIREKNLANAINVWLNFEPKQHPYRYLFLLTNSLRIQDQTVYNYIYQQYQNGTKGDSLEWKLIEFYLDKNKEELQAVAKKEEKEEVFYFFLGLRSLLQGKTDKTREYLNKCLKQDKESPLKAIAEAELESLR